MSVFDDHDPASPPVPPSEWMLILKPCRAGPYDWISLSANPLTYQQAKDQGEKFNRIRDSIGFGYKVEMIPWTAENAQRRYSGCFLATDEKKVEKELEEPLEPLKEPAAVTLQDSNLVLALQNRLSITQALPSNTPVMKLYLGRLGELQEELISRYTKVKTTVEEMLKKAAAPERTMFIPLHSEVYKIPITRRKLGKTEKVHKSKSRWRLILRNNNEQVYYLKIGLETLELRPLSEDRWAVGLYSSQGNLMRRSSLKATTPKMAKQKAIFWLTGLPGAK